MSRFIRSAVARSVALFVAVAMLLGPSGTAAAATFTIKWHTVVFPDQTPSWFAVSLPNEGDPHFALNGTGLPTRRVGDPYLVTYRIPVSSSFAEFAANDFTAPFDSTLLREGSNTFAFDYRALVNNTNGYPIETKDYVTLTGPGIAEQLLFRLAHNGAMTCKMFTDLAGNPGPDGTYDRDCEDNLVHTTSVSFTLEQIDPRRVQAVAALEAAIKADLDAYVANAAQVMGLAPKLDALNRLKRELADLLNRDIATIAPDDLNALLARYPDLPAATRAALVKLLEDMHEAVADLRAELARITRDVGQQADAIADIVESGARAGGFDPMDPAQYEALAGLGAVADIAVPDVGATATFDALHDPYAAYADAILARLGPLASGDEVTDRAVFMSVVRGWRANIRALEAALLQRGARQAEQNAFNAGRDRVATHLRRYVDGQDWFVNSPVPAQTKTILDGILTRQFADLAPRMKEALNEWRESRATAQQQLLLDTVDAIGAGAEEAEDELDPYDTRPMIRAALREVTAFIKTVVGLGTGMTPGVGDGIDICEAVTGREGCTASGAPISFGDRVASGLGIIIGSGKFWKGAGHVVAGAGGLVMVRMRDIAECVVDLGLAERKAIVRRLGQGIAHLDDIPGREIVRLTDKLGETTIFQLGPHLKGKGLQELEALRFFPEAVKFTGAVGAKVRGLPTLRKKTHAEIEGILRAEGFVPHPTSSVQEVWTHVDRSVIRIAPNGAGERPGPHLKREISKTPHTYGFDDIECKVTDDGIPVPKTPKDAAPIFRGWFAAKVGRTPTDDGPGSELDWMRRVWGDATHVEYIP